MAGGDPPVPPPEPGEGGGESDVVETDPSGRYSRFDHVLGRGAFKTVYKAFDEEEGTEVAWNQVRVAELVRESSGEERDRLFAEIRVLKQLKHRNIMSFHDSWLDDRSQTVNFITELFTSGTLRQYRKRHKHVDVEVLKRWAWQILCGLVYLHGHTPPIIHRDLKCDNVFINGSEGVVKIGDLGLATLLRARTAPQSVLGTPEFMAPELYEEDYDDRVDVYSFGMCLLELATLEYPYSECRNAAQIYRKVTLGVRPAGLARVPSRALADFVSLCIAPRDSRPRARQLLKHPYFESIRAEMRAGGPGRAAALAGVSGSTADLVLAVDPAGPSSGPLTLSTVRSASGSLAGDWGEGLPPQLSAVPEGSESDGDDRPPRSSAPSRAGSALPPRPPSRSGALSPPAVDLVSRRSLGSPRSDRSGGSAAAPGPAAAAPAPPRPSGPRSDGGSDDGSLRSACGPAVAVGAGREFRVKGRLAGGGGGDTLALRLRITQPGGPAKTVEFAFDLGADTALSVAGEMVQDLDLSRDDAASIAAAIRSEIRLLLGAAAAGDGRGLGGSRPDSPRSGDDAPLAPAAPPPPPAAAAAPGPGPPSAAAGGGSSGQPPDGSCSGDAAAAAAAALAADPPPPLRKLIDDLQELVAAAPLGPPDAAGVPPPMVVAAAAADAAAADRHAAAAAAGAALAAAAAAHGLGATPGGAASAPVSTQRSREQSPPRAGGRRPSADFGGGASPPAAFAGAASFESIVSLSAPASDGGGSSRLGVDDAAKEAARRRAADAAADMERVSLQALEGPARPGVARAASLGATLGSRGSLAPPSSNGSAAGEPTTAPPPQ